MVLNIRAFAVAAMLEIAGCFPFWSWLRNGHSPVVGIAGVVSLIGFAVMLTRVDTLFAGRAYAAYGGIYIAASLLWLWAVEREPPTVRDVVGALMVIGGAVVIIGSAARR